VELKEIPKMACMGMEFNPDRGPISKTLSSFSTTHKCRKFGIKLESLGVLGTTNTRNQLPSDPSQLICWMSSELTSLEIMSDVGCKSRLRLIHQRI